MTTPHDNDGGAAFPGKYEYVYNDLLLDHHSSGMSLREYFAAAALQGLLAHIIGVENANGRTSKYAERAYAYADAMLAARNVKR